MAKWIGAENKLVLPKSAIGKAFHYAIERWEEMSNYLLDGNLLLDNNLIENQIRPIALGRKNYLFAVATKQHNARLLFILLWRNARLLKLTQMRG